MYCTFSKTYHKKCSYRAHVNMNLNMGRVSPAISHLVFVATISSSINYSVEPKTKELSLMSLMFFLDFLFKQHMGSNVFLVVWRRIQIPRVWYCSIKSIGTLAPWHHQWEYKPNVWWGCRCEITAGSKEKVKVLSMKHFLPQTENNIPTTS